MMKTARLLVMTAALAAAGVTSFIAERPALAEKGHEDIALAIGETRTLPASGVKEYSEGVKGIVSSVGAASA